MSLEERKLASELVRSAKNAIEKFESALDYTPEISDAATALGYVTKALVELSKVAVLLAKEMDEVRA